MTGKGKEKAVEDGGTTGAEDELDTTCLEPPRKRQRSHPPLTVEFFSNVFTAAETHPA